MPLQDDMHLISVDDHLIEHSRVWLDRMPEKYQDALPPGHRERCRGHVQRVRHLRAAPFSGLAVRGQHPRPDGPQRRGRQAAGGAGARPRPLRGHDPRLLRPGRAGEGHGPRRGARVAVLPAVPQVRRHAVPQERGHGTGPALHRGLERLPHRRVVRHRPGPVHPAGHPSLLGRGGVGQGDPAGGGQGRPGDLVPGEHGHARPARRSTPTTGIRSSPPPRRRACRCACTSARRARCRAPPPKRRWRCSSR